MARDVITARQGDTLDELLWRERTLGPEALDAVLRENPGLADRGAVLPLGTRVTLPATPPPAPTRAIVNLWD